MSEEKRLTVDFTDLNGITEDTIKNLQKRLADAKGFVIGIMHKDDEVSGYIYMDEQGLADIILTFLEKYPSVAAEVIACLTEEECEETDEDLKKITSYIS